MSVTISDLLAATKEISVLFGQTALPVTYNPQLITSRVVNTASNDPDVLAEAVCKVVTGWGLADAAGDIPVGPGQVDAVASRVPVSVLSAVLQAVIGDQTPNPQTAAN